VDLKRAIDTQRLRLLRLVTGWVALLGFWSVGPWAVPLPRWARSYFAALLIRAEGAAQNLLQASASMQAGSGFVASAPIRHPIGAGQGDAPSVPDLLRRMHALRETLENLHRRAWRLLRVPAVSGAAFDWSKLLPPDKTPERWTMTDAVRARARVERPPDKPHDCGLLV